MSSNNILSINNYTLSETGNSIKYFFYPQYALIEKKITKKEKEFHVLFELEKEKEEKVYKLYLHLINSEDKKIYSSYSIYVKKLQKGKYAVIANKSLLKDENYIPEEIINFNKLNYESFITLLSEIKSFSRIIPELKKELKESINKIEEKKKMVEKMEFPTPLTYYQNINGYFIYEIEKRLITSNGISVSETILKNVRKNYDFLFKNRNQITLSYINLYSIFINKLKSTTTKPDSILSLKELKVELAIENIETDKLLDIINSIITKKECILNETEKELYDKLDDYIKQIQNRSYKAKLRILLCKSAYLDDLKKSRSLKESTLKDLILKGLNSLTYYPLPDNHVLIYTEENNIVDFITIIHLNKLHSLLKTFKKSSDTELKEYQPILKQLDNLIENKETRPTDNNIKIDLLILLLINLYNHKTVNKNNLLFNKGDYIIDLAYQKGDYDISIIHSESNKKHGHLTKLSEDVKSEIKNSLNKSEKAFIKYINNLIYDNIEQSLKELKIDISIAEYSHDGVEIVIRKARSKNSFDCKFNAKQLLLVLSNIKETKEAVNVNPQKQNTESEDSELKDEEIEYIIRKSKTIMEIMSSKKINNKNYQEIVRLYEKLFEVSSHEKMKILLELKKII